MPVRDAFGAGAGFVVPDMISIEPDLPTSTTTTRST
jgi:hypothetical protein